MNVRNRAKELANFVLNPDRVRAERAKVKSAAKQFNLHAVYLMIQSFQQTAMQWHRIEHRRLLDL